MPNEKPRTIQGEPVPKGALAKGLLTVSNDLRGTFKPKPQACAKAWAEAERHAARCPADKDAIYAATERFYGPRVEVDF